jgi:acyl-CoA reductase-like NAD-dependent aldehyde dehydrogenase
VSEKINIMNPYSGQVIDEVMADDETTVDQKFRKVAAQQHLWADTPLAVRLGILRKFHDLLAERVEILARDLSNETGKPISQARSEVLGTQGRVQFFLNSLEKTQATRTVFADEGQGVLEKITFEPLGVIGNISAWNYPYFISANVFVPALLLGNGVLYKPSEWAIKTGLNIADLLYDAGVPEGIFQVVIGGPRAGEALAKLDLNGMFFTGSYKTGMAISKAIGQRMVRSGFELGGKDPILVMDDVQVESAAHSLVDGCFYNAGQSCCAVERVYVEKSIYAEFLEAFVAKVMTLKLGDPAEPSTYLGPLTRKEQIKVLEDQVLDALAKGGRLLTGGKRWHKHSGFFEPTVFSDVNHKMKLMVEESFGPVIGIQCVTSADEALTLMNDSHYGLTAGVFSESFERAEAVLKRLDAGTVYWNCSDRVSPNLPWSGRHHSGIGSTLSTLGIEAFMIPKAWHLKNQY